MVVFVESLELDSPVLAFDASSWRFVYITLLPLLPLQCTTTKREKRIKGAAELNHY